MLPDLAVCWPSPPPPPTAQVSIDQMSSCDPNSIMVTYEGGATGLGEVRGRGPSTGRKFTAQLPVAEQGAPPPPAPPRLPRQVKGRSALPFFKTSPTAATTCMPSLQYHKHKATHHTSNFTGALPSAGTGMQLPCGLQASTAFLLSTGVSGGLSLPEAMPWGGCTPRGGGGAVLVRVGGCGCGCG